MNSDDKFYSILATLFVALLITFSVTCWGPCTEQEGIRQQHKDAAEKEIRLKKLEVCAKVGACLYL